jgi:hypothetical protein
MPRGLLDYVTAVEGTQGINGTKCYILIATKLLWGLGSFCEGFKKIFKRFHTKVVEMRFLIVPNLGF